jgi:hypothetical protein
MPVRARKRQPAPINPLDLDALKAAGLNSAAESARLLAEHQKRERIALEIELQRKKLGKK